MYSLIFLTKLGRQIKYYRTTKGVSQQKLANTLGIHRTYISSIERGERNVTVVTVQSICKALDISMSTLFSSMEEDGGVN